jgi:hypothetical protein
MALGGRSVVQAMKLMGHNFKEFDSNSTVMIVVRGKPPGRMRTPTTTKSSASCDRIPAYPAHPGLLGHT